MKRTLYIALVIILAFGGAAGLMTAHPQPVAAATTWTVDDDGPADFSKIQDAINAASSGDTINVAAGTYVESLNWDSKNIDIIGSGAATCTIDGNNTNRVISTSNLTAAARLEGFTITNGFNAAMWGGGMYNLQSSPTIANCVFSNNNANLGAGMVNTWSSPTITSCNFTGNTATIIQPTDAAGGGMCNINSSSPVITDCTFSNNTAVDWGGGISNTGSSAPIITNCTFTGNSATNGGGLGTGGGISNQSSSPTINSCTFSGNSADSGGGIFNTSSSPTITGSSFSSNDATKSGGAMWNYSSSPTITSCNFTGNTAVINAGGIYNTDSSSPTITNCNFSSNNANNGGGTHNRQSTLTIAGCTFTGNTADGGALNDAFGGGMYNYQSTLIITGSTFINNTVNATAAWVTSGGGMSNIDSSLAITSCNFTGNTANTTGGGIFSDNSTMTLTGCVLSGNDGGDYGGSMYNNDTSANITDCTFSGNTANSGGGMYNESSSPTISNCVFSSNVVMFGGGMYNALSSPTITNCTFYGNNAAGNGGGMTNEMASHPVITNCIFWADASEEFANFSIPVITYSDVQGGFAGTGNIDAGPLFVDAGGGNFHLRPFSPCIDAGSNTAVPGGITGDFEGDARIIDGDGDGNAVVDMGVDETTYPAINSFIPTSAGIGDSVTVTGVRFTGATAVKFGGTAASSFNVDSDTQITAVVGSGSSGNVTVTTPGGTATNSGFIYIPSPTITSFTPTSAGTGASVYITGTGLTWATTVKFGGTDASSFTVGSDTQITAVVGSGSSGNVTVTTPGGTATNSGFTYIPPPTGGGGGGSEYQYEYIDLLGERQMLITDYSGKVYNSVGAASPDGMLTIYIPEGTVIKNENGQGIHTLEINVNDNPPPPPEGANIIGLPYNFEPDGATFDPPITLTFTYDPGDIPEGISEEDLILAFYDEENGVWVELECICDPDTHCITACVSHFTQFAVIAYEPPPAPAVFSLSNLTIQPAEVEPGETVTVTVTITNTGGMEGDYSLILEVNEEYEESADVTIAAGETASVSFSLSKEQPGTYTVSVNGVTASYKVAEPAPAPTKAATTATTPSEPTPVATPTTPAPEPLLPESESTINWLLIGVLAAAGILIITFLIYRFVNRRD